MDNDTVAEIIAEIDRRIEEQTQLAHKARSETHSLHHGTAADTLAAFKRWLLLHDAVDAIDVLNPASLEKLRSK